jgi:hypothetical protein
LAGAEERGGVLILEAPQGFGRFMVFEAKKRWEIFDSHECSLLARPGRERRAAAALLTVARACGFNLETRWKATRRVMSAGGKFHS